MWTTWDPVTTCSTLEKDSPQSPADQSSSTWLIHATDIADDDEFDFSLALETFAAQGEPASAAISVPAPLPVICVHSTARQCFQFPDDPDHFNRLLTNGITGLTAIVPISSLFGDESFAAPHLYRAALAVTSLCAPPSLLDDSPWLSMDAIVNKKQALRHYTISIRSLHAAFPATTAAAFLNSSLQDLFVWFLTRLLLANCDLRLGHLAAWRAHLRAAGRILSAFHGRFMEREHGRQLAWAFARMALLVELQDRDMTVTGTQIMNPGVVSDLASMVERSDSARDRLLVLIRRIGNIELKYRYRLHEASKWVAKMQQIDTALAHWQRCLPPSELPVDTAVQDCVTFAVRSGLEGIANPVDVHPLTFPNALDPHFAAVNYAHFLCARMRSRTRYRLDGTKEAPRDTAATVMHICRIAAGLSASACSRAEAFGHGILPAIAGAYYWTSDPSLQNWIWRWLGEYEAMGAREGIWNVQQTRQLMVFLDEETERRRASQGTWEVVCARIQEEDDVLDEDSGVHDRAIRREERMLLEEGDVSHGSSLASGRCAPFNITLHSNSTGGWATHCFAVV